MFHLEKYALYPERVYEVPKGFRVFTALGLWDKIMQGSSLREFEGCI